MNASVQRGSRVHVQGQVIKAQTPATKARPPPDTRATRPSDPGEEAPAGCGSGSRSWCREQVDGHTTAAHPPVTASASRQLRQLGCGPRPHVR